MTKETDQRKRHRSNDNAELVDQYREIGIAAVAAAARYQSGGGGSTRPHTRTRSSPESGDRGVKTRRTRE